MQFQNPVCGFKKCRGVKLKSFFLKILKNTIQNSGNTATKCYGSN